MKVSILGCRGIPANHGGFETFAEHLALFLVERGHTVTVYCQSSIPGDFREDLWFGIRRVMRYGGSGASGTIRFDWAAARHARSEDGVILTLGYNTAVFSALFRLSGKTSLMNMDGIEWKRKKWSYLQRLWLRFNERAGALLSNHLIADHPNIGLHLEQFVSPQKITVIPYGAEPVFDADPDLLKPFQLSAGSYAIVIARPEPENSLLEIVEAFSQTPRGIKLVVLGRYSPHVRSYHRAVMEAASSEVLFVGPVYDPGTVKALRFFAQIYIHGHQMGGTNPSLVEALAAGNPILAHDNCFTRFVAGPEQKYFTGTRDLCNILDNELSDPEVLKSMGRASRARHLESYIPERVLADYENLLMKFDRMAPKNDKSSVASSIELR